VRKGKYRVQSDGTALNELVRFYDGTSLDEKASTAAYLVTIGEDDWPHAAMISVGELLIGSNRRAALAIWAHSQTTRNLIRTCRAVLLVVLSGRAVGAQLRLYRTDEVDGIEGLQIFTGNVELAFADAAPYASLTSAVKFRLHSPADGIARWRRTLDVLTMIELGSAVDCPILHGQEL
jgi:hypothetical protein